MVDTLAVYTAGAAGSGNAYSVDLTTRTVSFSGLVNNQMLGVVVDPTYTFGYISRSTGTVTQMTLPSGPLAAPTAVGTSCSAMAVTPNGTHLYVVDSPGNKVWPIAIPSMVVGAAITVPNPSGIAINHAGTVAYVSTTFNGLVPIAIPANTVGAGFPASPPFNLRGVSIMPNDLHAFVGSNSNLYDFDLVALTEVSCTTPAATAPNIPRVRPDGLIVALVDGGSGIVIIVDPATDTQTHVITLPGGAVGTDGGWDLNGTTLWVPRPGGGSQDIVPVDTVANTAGVPWAAGDFPQFIATIPATPTPPAPTGIAIKPLFIPRKASLEEVDLDIDWLAIQNWANHLNP